MLVTWLDQEARADERYEIRESASLGQCHVIACVRQAIQLAAVWSPYVNQGRPGNQGSRQELVHRTCITPSSVKRVV